MGTAELDLNAVIKDLRSHSVTVNWLFVVVFALCLLLVGGIYLHSVQTFQKLMDRADAENTQYHTDLTSLEAQLKTDMVTIAQLEAQKAQVETEIVYRDKDTNGKIVAVATPNRSETQISDDIATAYKFPPVKVENSLFSFTPPETQQFVVAKLDRDRLALDLQDTQKQLALGVQETTTQATDLQTAQKQLTESKKVIADYQKVAKKSKFKSFLGNVVKVAIFVGGIYIGRKL